MSSRIGAGEAQLISASGEGVTWINFEKTTSKQLGYLAQTYPFHPLDLEDCLSRRQLPKIDEYQDYLFILLHFPVFNKRAKVTQSSQVSIFLGRNYLVTVHQGDLKPLVNTFNACRQNEESRQDYLSRDSGYLLYRIMDILVDYTFPILNKVMGNLEDLEDKVFDQKVDAVLDVALLRRDIAAQRRIIWGLRGVVSLLETRVQAFTQEDLSVYFGDVLDHVNRAWSTLEECKDTIEIYKDTDYLLTQDSIQRVMALLTIAITVMVPFSIVSGIYGMNVPLPAGGGPFTFSMLLLLMLLISGGMLVYFRRQRWM
ncbi:MAG: magnesium transporter CorA family protein [Dehalococcoidia bacterium]|jgi:magnesium transporter|nr:magnesium transporter CorA family protein [Dehalococcoidia bacterium]MDP7470338.1 magnesium transporter CorA family protein [Dehalococcoidia bacterium]